MLKYRYKPVRVSCTSRSLYPSCAARTVRLIVYMAVMPIRMAWSPCRSSATLTQMLLHHNGVKMQSSTAKVSLNARKLDDVLLWMV